MKRFPRVDRSVWDFSSLEEHDIEVCWYYEIAKESSKIRKLFATAEKRKLEGRAATKRSGEFDADGGWRIDGLDEAMPKGFPGTPFQELESLRTRPRKPKGGSRRGLSKEPGLPEYFRYQQLLAERRKLDEKLAGIEPARGPKPGAQNFRNMRRDLVGLGYLRLRSRLDPDGQPVSAERISEFLAQQGQQVSAKAIRVALGHARRALSALETSVEKAYRSSCRDNRPDSGNPKVLFNRLYGIK